MQMRPASPQPLPSNVAPLTGSEPLIFLSDPSPLGCSAGLFA